MSKFKDMYFKCDKCNLSKECYTGKFFYGIRESISSKPNGGFGPYLEWTTTTKYKILGTGEAFICDECYINWINKAIKRTKRFIIINIFLFPLIIPIYFLVKKEEELNELKKLMSRDSLRFNEVLDEMAIALKTYDIEKKTGLSFWNLNFWTREQYNEMCK